MRQCCTLLFPRNGKVPDNLISQKKSMDIKILVATHKKAQMPQDSCYLPIHVGREGKQDLGYIGDDTGDNISSKNKSFCELTGAYWAWKNLECDYLGLVHYRRLFANGIHFTTSGKWASILTKRDFEALLQKADVILPKKRHYYIETSRSQYEHAHNPNDLRVLQDVIKERHPEYIKSLNEVLDKTSGHRFNMFIMRKDIFDQYCAWLFDILFELERRIDTSNYNKYNSRVFGFIGERLMDVWITTNRISFVEQNVLFMERQNWVSKIFQFLKRKFCGGVDYEH